MPGFDCFDFAASITFVLLYLDLGNSHLDDPPRLRTTPTGPAPGDVDPFTELDLGERPVARPG